MNEVPCYVTSTNLSCVLMCFNDSYPALCRTWPRSLAHHGHWWSWRWRCVHDSPRTRTLLRGWTSRTARHGNTDVRSPGRSVTYSQTARCSWRWRCPVPCWKTATSGWKLRSQAQRGNSWQRLQQSTAWLPSSDTQQDWIWRWENWQNFAERLGDWPNLSAGELLRCVNKVF